MKTNNFRNIYIKKYFFLLILCYYSSVIFAQEKYPDYYNELIKPSGLKYKKNFITINGLLDLEWQKPSNLNYGMTVQGGIRIFSKVKTKTRKNKFDILTAEREIFIKPTVGFYYRYKYNTGWMFIPEIAYRHTTPSGFFTDVNIDIGYLRTKINATTYEQKNDSTFNKINLGYNNILVGGKIEFGYDFSKKTEIPISMQVGFGVFYRYPNNTFWVRHSFAQIGVSYIFRKKLD